MVDTSRPPATHHSTCRSAMSRLASDYLAESGFIPALTCTPAGSDRFCPPTIERRIEEATNMQLTDRGGEP